MQCRGDRRVAGQQAGGEIALRCCHYALLTGLLRVCGENVGWNVGSNINVRQGNGSETNSRRGLVIMCGVVLMK